MTHRKLALWCAFCALPVAYAAFAAPAYNDSEVTVLQRIAVLFGAGGGGSFNDTPVTVLQRIETQLESGGVPSAGGNGAYTGTFNGTHTGDGAGLTNVTSTATGGNGVFTGSFNGTHTGNGAGLTNVTATLPSNVFYLNAANSGNVTATSTLFQVTQAGRNTRVSFEDDVFFVGDPFTNTDMQISRSPANFSVTMPARTDRPSLELSDSEARLAYYKGTSDPSTNTISVSPTVIQLSTSAPANGDLTVINLSSVGNITTTAQNTLNATVSTVTQSPAAYDVRVTETEGNEPFSSVTHDLAGITSVASDTYGLTAKEELSSNGTITLSSYDIISPGNGTTLSISPTEAALTGGPLTVNGITITMPRSLATRSWFVLEEFMNGTAGMSGGLAASNAGGTTATSAVTTTTEFGLLALSTGTNASVSQRAGVTTNLTSLMVGGNRSLSFIFRIAPGTNANGTDTGWIVGGFGTVVSSLDSSCIEWRSTNGGNWTAVTSSAGNSTTTDSLLAATTGVYRTLGIFVNAAGNQVRYTSGNTVIATHTTNIPTVALGQRLICMRSAATAANLTATADFVGIGYDLGTATPRWLAAP
jgi:hypothetical protein